jgi:hypothetical protein
LPDRYEDSQASPAWRRALELSARGAAAPGAELMAEIQLYARDGSVRAHVLVDDEDYAWLSQWRWTLLPSGYAYRRTRRGPSAGVIYMHRQILGLVRGDGRVGDHVNGDRLDNRRANLRVVTRRGNAQNCLSTIGSTSRFRGVSWNTARQKWIAQAWINGRQTNLGSYDSEEEAAAVAAEARRVHMPYSRDAREVA